MRIVIAPDSYKGSLSAREAALALYSGIREAMPEAVVVSLPVSDGGEGMASVVTGALGGEMVGAAVSDPLGRPVEAMYGIAGTTAVIEVAAACGLTLLGEDERAPLRTSTRGVGELILDAVGRGCDRFLVGLGGTATNDGGKGMLEVPGLLGSTRGMSFTIACDVDTPFIGPAGASRVFAPQKGASPADVEVLESRMAAWAGEILRETGMDVADMPGAGAAGGLGGAFAAYFAAHLVSGIDLVLDAIGFDEALAGADLVITGEGRADSQTGRGKAASGILRRAGRACVPVALIAGCVEDAEALERMGYEYVAQSSPDGMPLATAMRADVAAENLKNAAKMLCRKYLQ